MKLAWGHRETPVIVGPMANELDRGRRRFFQRLALLPVALALGSRLRWPGALDAFAAPGKPSAKPQPGAALAPTPDCGDDDEPTPAETAGPFFKPRSPLRTSLLEPGVAGTRIVLAGRVFSRECRPLAGVLLDFWHAGDDGEYDNAGFRLRGHQFTDAAGRYRLETVVPGLYPGRTRHIHVKVQAPHGRILTTQLYFPGEPRNQDDFLFRPDLLTSVTNGVAGKQAGFSFVLDLA